MPTLVEWTGFMSRWAEDDSDDGTIVAVETTRYVGKAI